MSFVERILIGLVMLTLLVLYIWERRKTRKVLNHVGEMLIQAKNGTFTESCFDESKLSAVEVQMKEWIGSTIATATQLMEERDIIKTTISDISHQTKTPISNISIYTELLAEQELPKDARIYVEQLEEQSQKLKFLIDALVKSSRLETRIVTVKQKEHRIEEILAVVCEQARIAAEKKQIIIERNVEPGNVYIDSKWTKEALFNIIDNAVKYGDRSSTVAIHGVKYAMFYRIDITNQGIGVRPEEVNAIFSRFYRSENVREEEGVGLGLYLAREIVQLQGGYIKVKPGNTPTFSVFLPFFQNC
ncbi:sensor histidine kinase [Anaerosporobacter faecicola]|uniref:sensor histidine kinase n=1 Tax=Anaerosporobacter faecicola TaxID=2718714 RepID=UPI00143B36BD|nr:HAMP domain-containing sensor histidine kinase [Anaerosporobacter faecicola]